jgi:hypothetical protein
MKSINDLKSVLRTEKDVVVTLEQLQQARAIYVDIAKECHKNKKYTQSNISLVVLVNSFLDYLKAGKAEDMKKTLFVNDNGNGYNAVLAKELEDGGYDNLLSIKIKSDTQAVTLVDDYDFYLVG